MTLSAELFPAEVSEAQNRDSLTLLTFDFEVSNSVRKSRRDLKSAHRTFQFSFNECFRFLS